MALLEEKREPLPADELGKTCSACRRKKSLNDFHKEKGGRFGRQRWCISCANAHRRSDGAASDASKLRRKVTTANYHQKHREKRLADGRKAFLLRRYGITIEEFDAIFGSQDGRCGLCLSGHSGGVRRWAVDHDHETGIVRGVLCHPCNTFLGMYEQLGRRMTVDKIIEWQARNPLRRDGTNLVSIRPYVKSKKAGIGSA